jgi:hypothetical protein
MKSSIFWDKTLCSPVKVNWCFRETYCLPLQGLLAACFMLLSYLAYSFSWRWRHLLTTQCYIPEDRTLHRSALSVHSLRVSFLIIRPCLIIIQLKRQNDRNWLILVYLKTLFQVPVQGLCSIKWSNDEDLEVGGHDPFDGTVLAFAWRDW